MTRRRRRQYKWQRRLVSLQLTQFRALMSEHLCPHHGVLENARNGPIPKSETCWGPQSWKECWILNHFVFDLSPILSFLGADLATKTLNTFLSLSSGSPSGSFWWVRTNCTRSQGCFPYLHKHPITCVVCDVLCLGGLTCAVCILYQAVQRERRLEVEHLQRGCIARH